MIGKLSLNLTWQSVALLALLVAGLVTFYALTPQASRAQLASALVAALVGWLVPHPVRRGGGGEALETKEGGAS